MQLTTELMYKALVEKDTAFEGVFFTAVKTTGIFCRPSCRARKPKLENVEFLKTAKECMLKGYRPCRVCNPLENFKQTPPHIQQLIQQISQNPSVKLKDHHLKQKGIEPAAVRRWFLKNHGITFHTFQRLLRLNHAFKQIQNGQPVTPTAFDTGFESLSGFGDSFKNIFGVSPKNVKHKTIIDLKRLETPLGTMMACATAQGICLLEFTDRKMLETELTSIATRLNAVVVQGNNPFFDLLEKQLAEYFKGQRRHFTVPLHTPGTGFQNKVWAALQQIPYGQTRSYQQQAAAIGCVQSVRAVAQANGANRVSILIPCHRVIASSGQLSGYGGGLWRKQYLLELEGGLQKTAGTPK